MQTFPIMEKDYVLSEKIDETPEVLLIRFTPADGKPSPFDPGMFSMIFGIDSEGKRWPGRAFSIASSPSSSVYEFYAVKVHAGHTTHFMEAKINDKYVLKGPNGQFRFDPATESKVLFLAGGTGVAPFMSMLRHIKETAAKTDVNMLYSIKYPTEVIRREELSSLQKETTLNLTITVTRPQEGDGWTGQTGHVDAEMIRKYAPDFMERAPYICGPLPFVKAIKDALLQLGMSPEQIKADVWG